MRKRKRTCDHGNPTTLVRGLGAPDHCARLRCLHCGHRVPTIGMSPPKRIFDFMPWNWAIEIINRNRAREQGWRMGMSGKLCGSCKQSGMLACHSMCRNYVPPAAGFANVAAMPSDAHIDGMVRHMMTQLAIELHEASDDYRPKGERHLPACPCERCKNTKAHGND